MIKWRIMFDGKGPDDAPVERLYRIALEQAAWADQRGLSELWVDEHHGAQNLPAPLAMAAALGAVTSGTRIGVGCLLLPLLDPVRVAEDVIVADLVSEGRIEVIAGLGYVPHEFEMFGVKLEDRARSADEKLPVLLSALAGERFEYRGRRGTVWPRPVQQPRPPVLVGGGVAASARRAARFGDGFAPTVSDEELFACYRSECARLGRPAGSIVRPNQPLFVFVADDPERAWAELGPSLLHEVDQYRRWVGNSGTQVGYHLATDEHEAVAALRARPDFAVVTPEECVALARRLPDGARLTFKPARGGLPADLGWESLELFAAHVLPHVEVAPPEPAAVVLSVGSYGPNDASASPEERRGSVSPDKSHVDCAVTQRPDSA